MKIKMKMEEQKFTKQVNNNKMEKKLNLLIFG